ncbi:MAG TPA: hypothetical protein VFF73_33945 [Planctomycetota bacterium]|nr:hypothetical protein [Planctomycetota bacterium]
MATTSRRSWRFVLPALLALFAAAVHAQGDAPHYLVCPLDGQTLECYAGNGSNEAGGRDSDGCRWVVGADGRLEVLELREILACPRCGMALYRAHLEAAAKLGRSAAEAAISSGILAAGPIDPGRLETVVAHAVATYRALGLASLGIKDDADVFEGKLWVRAAWAARMRLVRDDEAASAPPIVSAPRTADEAQRRVEVDLDAIYRTGGATKSETAAYFEDALGNLDQVRSTLDPLDRDKEGPPSRRLAFEQTRSALDTVERTLLLLRASLRTDKGLDLTGRQMRELALAIGRAAHRAGDAARREQWLDEATKPPAGPEWTDAAQRTRDCVKVEEKYLALAAAALEKGASRCEGERRAGLLALAADMVRRLVDDPKSELVWKARALATHAAEGAGAASPAARHSTFLLERLGR